MINYDHSYVDEKVGKLWSDNKKVVCAHVGPPKMNTKT